MFVGVWVAVGTTAKKPCGPITTIGVGSGVGVQSGSTTGPCRVAAAPSDPQLVAGVAVGGAGDADIGRVPRSDVVSVGGIGVAVGATVAGLGVLVGRGDVFTHSQ